jgi:hypothetical protein
MQRHISRLETANSEEVQSPGTRRWLQSAFVDDLGYSNKTKATTVVGGCMAWGWFSFSLSLSLSNVTHGRGGLVFASLGRADP